MNYWEECISTAADECGLKLTKEQLKYLADAAEGGHENYGMAFGMMLYQTKLRVERKKN